MKFFDVADTTFTTTPLLYLQNIILFQQDMIENFTFTSTGVVLSIGHRNLWKNPLHTWKNGHPEYGEYHAVRQNLRDYILMKFHLMLLNIFCHGIIERDLAV